jgi:hypothetical protein
MAKRRDFARPVPGSSSFVWEAADADLVADVMVWSTRTYGAPEGPRAFVSTIKLRHAGFTKTLDTEDSFRNALQSLIDRKLLAPAAK